MKRKRLKAAIAGCFTRFNCRSAQVYSLHQQLEARNQELKALQLQLDREKADLCQKPYELRDSVAAIFALPDESLQATARFPVRKALAGSGWEVVTGYCCLGGCDLDVYSFQTEREALLYSAFLKAVGYHPMCNIACHTCYLEYMKDCI